MFMQKRNKKNPQKTTQKTPKQTTSTYIDSMEDFTTENATNIQTAIFGTSYNKYVRPSATTIVGIELNLLSVNEMVTILFKI